MLTLSRFRQNLVQHSDMFSSDWSAAASAIITAPGSSPAGQSFTITDSSPALFGYAVCTAPSSVTAGENVAVSMLYRKQTVVSSVISLLRIHVGAGVLEFVDLVFNPSRPEVSPSVVSVGSVTYLDSFLRPAGPEWCAVGLTVRRDTSSGNAPTVEIYPAVGFGPTIYTTSATGALEVSAVQIQKGRFGPYIRTSGAAVTTPSDYVDLDPIRYERKDEVIQNIHRMKSGRGFRYVWGSQAKVKFKVQTSSATAAIVNSWWSVGAGVVLQQQDDPTLVMSCYIANRASPVAEITLGDPSLIKGTIELEAF